MNASWETTASTNVSIVLLPRRNPSPRTLALMMLKNGPTSPEISARMWRKPADLRCRCFRRHSTGYRASDALDALRHSSGRFPLVRWRVIGRDARRARGKRDPRAPRRIRRSNRCVALRALFRTETEQPEPADPVNRNQQSVISMAKAMPPSRGNGQEPQMQTRGLPGLRDLVSSRFRTGMIAPGNRTGQMPAALRGPGLHRPQFLSTSARPRFVWIRVPNNKLSAII